MFKVSLSYQIQCYLNSQYLVKLDRLKHLPTHGLWFTILNMRSQRRFMWLFGQMHPNMGDSLRFVQDSWHNSLKIVILLRYMQSTCIDHYHTNTYRSYIEYISHFNSALFYDANTLTDIKRLALKDLKIITNQLDYNNSSLNSKNYNLLLSKYTKIKLEICFKSLYFANVFASQ